MKFLKNAIFLTMIPTKVYYNMEIQFEIIVRNMDELLKKLIIDFGNYDITFVTYIKWKMWIQKMSV